jgi:peptide/nickel transport system substrate-binding protein
MYSPGVLPVSSSSPFFDPAMKVPPRDLAKAKALLKQAGVPLPVKLDLMTPNQPDVLQEAEVIQSMAAEAGFDIHIQAIEFASSLEASRRGDYQAYLIGWSGRVDVDGNTYQFLRSGQGNNASGYSNPIADKLLDEGRAMVDLAKRQAVYNQLWPVLRQDLPITYLYNGRNIVGMTVKLQGYRPIPDGMIRLQGLEMTK